MKREYRVVWKREGLRRAAAIYQTREGALAKAARLHGEFTVLRDGAHGTVWEMEGTEWLDDQGVPDLEYLHVEMRTVGEWAYIGPGGAA